MRVGNLVQNKKGMPFEGHPANSFRVESLNGNRLRLRDALSVKDTSDGVHD
jgi:hypothetical protein